MHVVQTGTRLSLCEEVEIGVLNQAPRHEGILGGR
jgi:hypothetical protein